MENNNQISAQEYCEISKLYLKKLAEIESKKAEELELYPEKHDESAVKDYLSQQKTDAADDIEVKLRNLFQEDYAELNNIVEKLLANIGNITKEEIKES